MPQRRNAPTPPLSLLRRLPSGRQNFPPPRAICTFRDPTTRPVRPSPQPTSRWPLSSSERELARRRNSRARQRSRTSRDANKRAAESTKRRRRRRRLSVQQIDESNQPRRTCATTAESDRRRSTQCKARSRSARGLDSTNWRRQAIAVCVRVDQPCLVRATRDSERDWRARRTPCNARPLRQRTDGLLLGRVPTNAATLTLRRHNGRLVTLCSIRSAPSASATTRPVPHDAPARCEQCA